jgi:hypothetical protein
MLWSSRTYMPTFTGASLIAAGTGAVLAAQARPAWRVRAVLPGLRYLPARLRVPRWPP